MIKSIGIITIHVRDIDFTETPNAQPWGKQAQIVDQDGNGFVLVEVPEGS